MGRESEEKKNWGEYPRSISTVHILSAITSFVINLQPAFPNFVLFFNYAFLKTMKNTSTVERNFRWTKFNWFDEEIELF